MYSAVMIKVHARDTQLQEFPRISKKFLEIPRESDLVAYTRGLPVHCTCNYAAMNKHELQCNNMYM